MKIIADLQLHSKYSRAVSPRMDVEEIFRWAVKKGMGLMATGDWTHPLWLRELKSTLNEDGTGFLKLKPEIAAKISNFKFPRPRRGEAEGGQISNKSQITNSKFPNGEPKFLLATEISSIYTQGGKVRRIHNLVWAPSFATVDKIIAELHKRGCNLGSDGRPIVGLTSRDIAEMVLSIDEQCLVIPAHCLPAGEKIHTKEGMKNIEVLQKSDHVLTHRGRFQPVTRLLKRPYKGSMYTIQPWYFSLGLTTTDEHPYYAIKTIKKCRSTGDICRPFGKHLTHCSAKHYEKYQPAWVQAKHLNVGDLLLFPRMMKIKNKRTVGFADLKKTIVITDSFCRLIGYYLAEGYIDSKGGISFAFSSHEREYLEDVKRLMSEVFSLKHHREYHRKHTSGIELIYYSKVVASFLSKLCYRKNAERFHASTKALAPFFLYLRPKLQVELIRGWWRGDKGYTSSRELMNQLKTILLRLGIIPSIYVDTVKSHKKRGNHRIGNRTVKAMADNYLLTRLAFFDDTFGLLKEKEFAHFNTTIDRRHGFIDKQYIYLPIKKIIRKEYSGSVYNLEVEDDNSYTAEFACVHNCWTPWFSLYGSKSGFDSIEECFGDYSKYIYAIETGLSSDPSANWRIADLDNRAILSFSDAHSGPKLGREATVFELTEMTYNALREAITSASEREMTSANKISCTFEFYPEEGKYHYTGHRLCHVKQTPVETKKMGTICHVCGKPLTVGVMHRVEELAAKDVVSLQKVDASGVRWMYHPENKKPPYVNLVPLLEIIAEVYETAATSIKVLAEYDKLVDAIGSEFTILVKADLEKITAVAGDRMADAIKKVRAGDIFIDPGYDGEFGKVKIWPDAHPPSVSVQTGESEKKAREQMSLF